MEKTDQKAQKAIDQSTENQGELKHLKFLFDDLEERYNKQQNLLNQDLKNRSLRIEQLSLFKIWAKSKMKNHGKTLIKDASKPNLKSHSRLLRKWGRTSYNIERAHRQPLNQNGNSKSKTPVIIVKFANWSFSEKVKSGFIEASWNGENSNNGFSDVLHRPSGAAPPSFKVLCWCALFCWWFL